jgi:hypothetical protein
MAEQSMEVNHQAAFLKLQSPLICRMNSDLFGAGKATRIFSTMLEELLENPPKNASFAFFDGAAGELVATIQNFTVEPKTWKQIGSVLAINAPGTNQGYAKVTRVSGNYPFIAYAVINDGTQPGERTGDGIYLSSSP